MSKTQPPKYEVTVEITDLYAGTIDEYDGTIFYIEKPNDIAKMLINGEVTDDGQSYKVKVKNAKRIDD